MFPISDEFLFSLRSSHTVEIAVTAYYGGSVVVGAEDLLVTEGAVRVDGRSQVRRTLEGLKVVASDGVTSTLRDLLSPPGTELQVARGIRFPNGVTEFAPIGRFVVDEIVDDLARPGAVTLTAPDRFRRLQDDRFLTPRAATAGSTIVAQIAALITETIPGVTVTDLTGSTDTVPTGVVWERERADAIDDLASSIGAVVYADPSGDFVIAPAPSLTGDAVWTVNAGSNGVLLGGDRKTVRGGVWNSVVATSSPTDGSTPVYGIAEDTDPTSPTYVSGPFGRVTRFYSSPLLTTADQATAAATSILSRSLGRRQAISLSSMVNPALEIGDRIDVVFPDGALQYHLVDGFTVPLSPSAPMPIETRSTEVTE